MVPYQLLVIVRRLNSRNLAIYALLVVFDFYQVYICVSFMETLLLLGHVTHDARLLNEYEWSSL